MHINIRYSSSIVSSMHTSRVVLTIMHIIMHNTRVLCIVCILESREASTYRTRVCIHACTASCAIAEPAYDTR